MLLILVVGYPQKISYRRDSTLIFTERGPSLNPLTFEVRHSGNLRGRVIYATQKVDPDTGLPFDTAEAELGESDLLELVNETYQSGFEPSCEAPTGSDHAGHRRECPQQACPLRSASQEGRSAGS